MHDENPIDLSETDTPETRSRCARRHRGRARFWRFFSLSILVAALAAFVVPALAFGPFGGHRRHADWTEEELTEHLQHVSEFVMDELDGTEEQQTQINEIIARVTPDAVALRDEAHALGDELRTALQAEVIDAAAVETARAGLVDVVDRGSRLATNTILELAGVLTPEQRETLSTWIEEWHD